MFLRRLNFLSRSPIGWKIERISESVLKCSSSSKSRYFEKDELSGEGAFKDKDAITASKFFSMLIEEEVKTTAFQYEDTYMVLTPNKLGLIVKDLNDKEKNYFSFQTLKDFLIETFLVHLNDSKRT